MSTDAETKDENEEVKDGKRLRTGKIKLGSGLQRCQRLRPVSVAKRQHPADSRQDIALHQRIQRKLLVQVIGKLPSLWAGFGARQG